MTASRPHSSILFLDLDDVVVLERPVEFDKHRVAELAPDVCQRMIHPPAGQTLVRILEEVPTKVVVTSNWLRFTSRPSMERLFQLAGYPQIARALHEFWCAPRTAVESRLNVIDQWLVSHHRGEGYCVVDDSASGVSLVGSRHDQARRVLLGSEGVGLHLGHVPFIKEALMASAA